MSDTQLSLDLGEYFLRVAEGNTANNQIDISAMGILNDTPLFYEYENEKTINEESEAIHKLMYALKIRQKNIHIVVPDTFTYSQILTMPRLKEKELLSAIRYQADQFIPLPINETSLDLEILREDKLANTLLVLIVAAPLHVISKIETLCEVAGLTPLSIENELSSTGRLISQFYQPDIKEGGTIFVNFSYSTTSLYYFDHQLRLTLDTHSFKVGYSLFLKETQINTLFDMAKSRDVLKRIGFSTNETLNLSELLKPSKNVFIQEVEKFILSVKEKFKTTVQSVQLINLSTEINSFEKTIAKGLSIPAYNLNLQPYTKKNTVVNAYSHELSSFAAAIGGFLT